MTIESAMVINRSGMISVKGVGYNFKKSQASWH